MNALHRKITENESGALAFYLSMHSGAQRDQLVLLHFTVGEQSRKWMQRLGDPAPNGEGRKGASTPQTRAEPLHKVLGYLRDTGSAALPTVETLIEQKRIGEVLVIDVGELTEEFYLVR